MKLIKTIFDTDYITTNKNATSLNWPESVVIRKIENLFEESLQQQLALNKNHEQYPEKSYELLTLFIQCKSPQEHFQHQKNGLFAYIFFDEKPVQWFKKNTLVLNRNAKKEQWQSQIYDFITVITQQPINLLLEEFSGFNLYGHSSQFIHVIKTIKKVARCDAPVLIQGETGTGKENTARAIHYLSARKDHAFVPINCGAISENLIEAELFGHEKGAYTGAEHSKEGLIDIAHNGTLFLDEVDSLSAKAQTVLLRFLQSGEYRAVGSRKLKTANVHIITATNTSLENNISRQLFRQDLYYRLKVFTIDLPPLRERPDDIRAIAEHLMQKLRIKHKEPKRIMSEEFIVWLQQQRWAGNIRELENTLLREFLLCSGNIIEPPNEVIPNNDLAQPALSFKDAKDAAITRFEIAYIQKVLKITNGNVSRAAKIAGKERRAFGKLIKKHHIERTQWALQKG